MFRKTIPLARSLSRFALAPVGQRRNYSLYEPDYLEVSTLCDDNDAETKSLGFCIRRSL